MKTILVVDDSPVDRLLIRRVLEQNSEFRLLCADDGVAALKLLNETPVDLVVTDLQMPVLDGLHLVQTCKQRWPNLPFVLVAGQGSEQTAIAALRAGAANYSPKAFIQKDLLTTVQSVLEMSDQVQLQLGDPANRQSTFVLENDCKLIGPILEHLQAQLPEWSDATRLQIGMALGEALTNAMHHGNLEVQSCSRSGDDQFYYQQIHERRRLSPYCDRRVRVQLQSSADEIRIDVRDEGQGFDPDLIEDPRHEANLTKLSGRGLLLMRSFMDEIRFSQNGTHLVMIKRRASNSSPNQSTGTCTDSELKSTEPFVTDM